MQLALQKSSAQHAEQTGVERRSRRGKLILLNGVHCHKIKLEITVKNELKPSFLRKLNLLQMWNEELAS